MRKRWKTVIKKEWADFFMYLMVVRGHKMVTAVRTAQALSYKGDGKNKRLAKRHYRDFKTKWWWYAEEDESFDLWSVVFADRKNIRGC